MVLHASSLPSSLPTSMICFCCPVAARWPSPWTSSGKGRRSVEFCVVIGHRVDHPSDRSLEGRAGLGSIVRHSVATGL
eukprot:2628897-Pyramimonas_sp.AAC.1